MRDEKEAIKRRTFLKTAALGSASLALSTGLPSKFFSAAAEDASLIGSPSQIGDVPVIYFKAHPLDQVAKFWLSPTPPKLEFKPNLTAVLKKGAVMKAGCAALPCDIEWVRDVAVPMRDGVKIYVDIFRPVGGTNLPALIGWSPYGKIIPQDPAPFVQPQNVSGLQKFEGPDPAYWCNHGYAVINPDARGAFYSEGDVRSFGSPEGKDGHDLIEWVGVQPWCSGKVATTGNSWLGISQWYIAAERPPHLVAFAPWEGETDLYNQYILRGGIPDIAIPDDTMKRMIGRNLVEDIGSMAEKYTLMNGYWQDKIAKLDNIAIPAYVVANFGTHHTIDGFRWMASKDKWLRVHNTNEWPDYYAPEHKEDLRRFFDHYLKGVDNGWEKTPRVRLAVFDLGGKDIVDRPEAAWPLARTKYTKFYLNGETGSLSSVQSKKSSKVSYISDDQKGQATFTIKFEKDTELSGYVSLRLWVENDAATDMDIFAIVQKLDANGKPLQNVFNYMGPDGRLRASHRKLDSKRSRPWFPMYLHEAEEPVKPGQIVPLDIALRPTGMLWHAGQQMRLVIAGYNTHNVAPSALGAPKPIPTRNKGNHIVHTGGRYDSHLLVPVVS